MWIRLCVHTCIHARSGPDVGDAWLQLEDHGQRTGRLGRFDRFSCFDSGPGSPLALPAMNEHSGDMLNMHSRRRMEGRVRYDTRPPSRVV